MFPKYVHLDRELVDSRIFHSVWQSDMTKVCTDHKIWQSDFVDTLRNGVDKKQCFLLAKEWAQNMIFGSFCFPRYVAVLAARAESEVVRYGLLENAWDESGRSKRMSRSHFWLAVQLAKLLTMSEQEIESFSPSQSAQTYTDEHYRYCGSGSFEFALGMICLIEEFTTPEFTLIFNAFLRGCEEGLGLTPEEFVLNGGAEYFTANISDDERHRQEMPRIVATQLSIRGVDLQEKTSIKLALNHVEQGMLKSLDFRYTFFQEIYDTVCK